MAVDFGELVKSGVDIAGSVNEKFINKFAASHHAAVPNLYKGSQRFSQFDNDIEIRFNVAVPIEFDFSPFTLSKFRRVWSKHLSVRGVDPVLYREVLGTPPNVKLTCQEVEFEIIIYDGHSNKVVLAVDFSWNLEAIAAVLLSAGSIKLQPLRVSFSAGSSFVSSEISRRIMSKATSKGVPQKKAHPTTFGDPSDPVWCAKLEQMILLLLNQVLATQITNFIRNWELPRAVEVADGVAIQPMYLAIHGDDLVVGAQVTTLPIGQSILETQIDALVIEFTDRAEKEFRELSDEDLRLWHPDDSPTIQWISEYARVLDRQLVLEVKKHGKPRSSKYDPNIQMLFNDKLFDVVAKKYLSINKGWRGSKELDRLLRASIGWWFRIENAKAKVIHGGIQVNADVHIGGDATVGHFDIDPKHFGDWKDYVFGVDLYPVPDFGLQILPSFAADGGYISARLLTTGIGIILPGWPGWANDIIGWVSGNLTRPLLAAIAAVIALFRVRILKYPHHFPGTSLEWIPNFNATPDNVGPYLVFSADPEFK